MIISHTHRIVFYSNPKTGSESLRSLLAPLNEEPVRPWKNCTSRHPFYPHMPPTEALNVFAAMGWNFAQYRHITCVRNPFPRLVSLYEMIREVDGVWALQNRLGFSPPSFQKWLERTRPNGLGGGGRSHQRWRRFGAYSADAWCAGLVPFVLRLEHLEQEWPVLIARLGLPVSYEVPHENKRVTRNWAEYYDSATTPIVMNRYAKDLQRFGYHPPTANLNQTYTISGQT